MKAGKRMQELCREQREEILSLKQQITDRNKELAALTKVISKYSAVLPEFSAFSACKPTGNDLWTPLFPQSSQVSVSFSEIAAKGLWVTSRKRPSEAQTRHLQGYGSHQSESLPEIHFQHSKNSRKNAIYGKKSTLRGKAGRRASEASGDPLPVLRPVRHY